ncbi:hypothetical protein L249_7419 [Ophiocordyceps polyrhachis-furcata BCC 54312]|uniref:Uncharacterized protein n=1 Tax=Ophiocordyceps polyrhachis-furcata BCC 54312 TaxID=1330021 RepID=A0A367LAZ5_9HYPO|nr:hypothetical protein L249_7419 [Ophiocordyceps polyrhachis-furcata BCC 54312]
MWGKSRAVEEEEGGEKLVEIEIIISNQGVDHYSAPIDVTAAFPTVTQGVVAGLRPNWYNLFQVALQAYFLSV